MDDAIEFYVQQENIRIIKPLGSGSYGNVFLVEKDGKKLTMKVSLDEEIAKNIWDEASIVETVSRYPKCFPNISCYVDHALIYESVGTRSKERFSIEKSVKLEPRWILTSVVMLTVHIEGQNLYEFVESYKDANKDIPSEYVYKWMLQAYAVVHKLHDLGIYHRDIKPQNMIIDNNNDLYVIDLGMSCINGKYPPCGDLFSTQMYTPPEYLTKESFNSMFGPFMIFFEKSKLAEEMERDDSEREYMTRYLDMYALKATFYYVITKNLYAQDLYHKRNMLPFYTGRVNTQVSNQFVAALLNKSDKLKAINVYKLLRIENDPIEVEGVVYNRSTAYETVCGFNKDREEVIPYYINKEKLKRKLVDLIG